MLREPPTMAVEIHSPSDKIEDVADKIEDYREAGVPLVLKNDPVDRTVLVYRPGTRPQLFKNEQDLKAERDLPGFRSAVADIFAP